MMGKGFAEAVGGRFISAVALILSGILFALMILGWSMWDVVKAERALGACEVACEYRGYEDSNVNADEECSCKSPGSVVWQTVDPHERP